MYFPLFLQGVQEHVATPYSAIKVDLSVWQTDVGIGI